MGYEEYQIGMSWDSYEGSLYRETSTTWKYAYSSQDAEQQARSEFGSNKGFKIEYVTLNN